MSTYAKAVVLAVLLAPVLGCGQSTADTRDGTINEADSGPPGPLVPQFGHDASRQLRSVATGADGLSVPRDLEFHPTRTNELWIVNRAIDGVTIIFDPDTPGQTSETRVDAFGNHFMEEVATLAMGANDTFAVCNETRNTYDGQTPPDDFMGPALWPSDLSVFAVVNQDPFGQLLGSHLDMLHQSPLCMGIAHVQGNAYFVFDGHNGHVVYYDFQADHGPGNDDHSDGIVHRYVDAEVTRVPDVPGHLILDEQTGMLYVADTGGRRILRVDTNTGGLAGTFPVTNEVLTENRYMVQVTVDVFASANLVEPSGIALSGDHLFVSDHATGEIIAYDLDSAAEIERIQTGVNGIMGIELGPNGRLWFVDSASNAVVVVDPGT